MNWNNVKFHSPWVLILIPLSIALVFWFWRRRHKSLDAVVFPWLGHLPLPLTSTLRVWVRRIVLGLCLLGWCLWLIALARPQRHDDLTRQQARGIDIMLVLDTSESMNIEDVLPNRFEVAVSTMIQFVNKRTLDRIGLVVFGGESFTFCPLTLDHEVVVSSLKNTRVNMTRAEGTAIGTAVANAVARLKDSSAKSRVLILLTDGANNQGNIDPLTAGDLAAGYGIKIYSIGLGREGPVPFPFMATDLFGRSVKRYQQIQSSIDHELLNKLAEKTGGEAFSAEDASALEKIFARIDTLETTEIEGLKLSRVTELFALPLAIGTLLLGVSMFLLGTFLRVFP